MRDGSHRVIGDRRGQAGGLARVMIMSSNMNKPVLWSAVSLRMPRGAVLGVSSVWTMALGRTDAAATVEMMMKHHVLVSREVGNVLADVPRRVVSSQRRKANAIRDGNTIGRRCARRCPRAGRFVRGIGYHPAIEGSRWPNAPTPRSIMTHDSPSSGVAHSLRREGVTVR